MKTIELKWIEDDNHVVAEDAYNGLKELIDTGVFPDLTAKCEDDTLYITGEKEDLDKAVMKIQKAYAKYGQIMIKEAKNGVSQELRIESFDENVQDIFNHTLDDYNKFKSSKERPLNYVKQLNDYRFKFKKFYETAARSDKKLLKPYLDEISNLLDESEIVNKIKPIKKINEGKLIDADALNVMLELIDLGYNSDAASKIIKKYTNFINQELKDGAKPYWIAKLIEDDLVNHKFSDKDEKESYDEALRKQLSNPSNWGIIEEKMTRFEYNDKFERVARMYAEETGKDIEDVYDELMDNDELPEYVDSDMDVYDIVYKVLSESTMNESWLSPAELKKKLQRVAMKWASEEGIKYEIAYNDLRKRKSVKDMLDFYTVDEIIDDLKKKKKEVDDELEEEI
jgi:hypothetical protein